MFEALEHTIWEVEFMSTGDTEGAIALRDFLIKQANALTEFIGLQIADRDDLESRLEQLDELGE